MLVLCWLISTINFIGPLIEIEKNRYYIREPTFFENDRKVTVTIVRRGDLSKTIFVTAFTKDGSAKSGLHYQPVAKVNLFSCVIFTYRNLYFYLPRIICKFYKLFYLTRDLAATSTFLRVGIKKKKVNQDHSCQVALVVGVK